MDTILAQNPIFVSYSHQDEAWRQELEKMLKPMIRQGLNFWSDQQIPTGARWREEIDAALEAASIGVLLVSSDFLASDFIHDHELGPLLKRAEANGVTIAWVPVGHCLYEETAIGAYQAIGNPDQPLSVLAPEELGKALKEIAREIVRLARTSKKTTIDPVLAQKLSTYFQNALDHVNRDLGERVDEFVAPALSPFERNGSSLAWYATIEQENILSLSDLVHRLDPERPEALALFGPAGAGKSLCLYMLFRSWLQAGLQRLGVGEMPEVVPFRTDIVGFASDHAALPIELLKRIAYGEGAALSQDQLLALQNEKRLAIFLDGLHEVRGRQLGEAFNTHYHWYFSCRPGLANQVPERAVCFRIEGFDEARRLELLTRCLEVSKQELLRRWARRPRVRQLVRVPHLWRMALEVGEDLASYRITSEADIYRHFIEQAISRHFVDFEERGRQRMMGNALAALGFIALTREGRTVPLDDLNRWVVGYQKAHGAAQPLESGFDLGGRMTRFFQPVAEGGSLAFVHGNLGLYLAARFIYDFLPELVDELSPATHDDLQLFLVEIEYASEPERARERLGSLCDGLWEQGIAVLGDWLVRLSGPLLEAGLDFLRPRLGRLTRSDRKLLLNYLRARDPELLRRLASGLEQKEAAAVLGRSTQSREAREKDRKKKRRKLSEKLETVGQPMSHLWPELMGTRDSRRQCALINHIAVFGASDDVGLLIRFLDGGSGHTRGAAARAMGLLGGEKAEGKLRKLLRDTDDFVVSEALGALGQLDATEAIEEIEALLGAANPFHRAGAARALGFLGARGSATAVCQLLKDPQREVRGTAATALGMLGDAEAVRPLIGRLDPNAEDQAAVRGSAATALGLLGDAEAVRPLIGRLDPNAEEASKVRGSAATALGLLGDAEAVRPLIGRLDPNAEPGSDVRGSAATALGMLGDAEAVRPLIARLDPNAEEDPKNRGSAATALGMLGDAEAVKPLIGRLDPNAEPGSDVRGSAATALGLIALNHKDDHTVVDPIRQALDGLDDPDRVTRHSAKLVLARLARVQQRGPVSALPADLQARGFAAFTSTATSID